MTDLVAAPYGLFTSENVNASIAAAAAAGYTMTALYSSENKTWQIVVPGGSITEK